MIVTTKAAGVTKKEEKPNIVRFSPTEIVEITEETINTLVRFFPAELFGKMAGVGVPALDLAMVWW